MRKKMGCDAVLSDVCVLSVFLAELADGLMYYQEGLRRCHVTPDEISRAYEAKHLRNMGRDYTKEYKELYHNG